MRLSKLKTFKLLIILCFGAFLVNSCVTYYQKNLVFQEHFVKGDLEKADKTLDKNKRAAEDKNRLLYFLQKGVVLQMSEKYEESNAFFEKAYIYSEDYRKNYSREAISVLSNPTIKPYTGEDHELVLIHYFKIINYLKMSLYDEALVECRRINNKLNLLNDRYENKKNNYKRDAFAMNLMGIIYEASGDVNNAFIAYRNALEAYEEDYSLHFETDTPPQLKKDLLRTAYLNGFTEELQMFEEKFGQKYEHVVSEGGDLLCFWHNGLGPVKDEWSINFFMVKGQGGVVMFVNEELGLSFPFPLPSNGQSTGGIGDLKFVRVAFPKYVERKPYYQSGEIITGQSHYNFELAENINKISFVSLEDRMQREMAISLMRLALKQTAELVTRQQNQNLGALLSVVNAVSEKSDTRNWQTLPYSILYTRIPLKEASNDVKFKLYSPKKSQSKELNIEIQGKKGKTAFHVFQTLESIPLSLDYY